MTEQQEKAIEEKILKRIEEEQAMGIDRSKKYIVREIGETIEGLYKDNPESKYVAEITERRFHTLNNNLIEYTCKALNTFHFFGRDINKGDIFIVSEEMK